MGTLLEKTFFPSVLTVLQALRTVMHGIEGVAHHIKCNESLGLREVISHLWKERDLISRIVAEVDGIIEDQILETLINLTNNVVEDPFRTVVLARGATGVRVPD